MILQMNCPSCGIRVSGLAAACPTCGFPVVLYASMMHKRGAHDYEPLELVAMNPHTPPVILEMLLNCDNPAVRSALTLNPCISEGFQHQLACDEDVGVRLALASSPFTTVEVMERLSCDKDCDVIDALFQNDATPEYIRRELECQLEDDDGDYGGEAMYFDEDNGWLTELP